MPHMGGQVCLDHRHQVRRDGHVAGTGVALGSTRRVTEVAAEIRMSEANINRWVGTPGPRHGDGQVDAPCRRRQRPPGTVARLCRPGADGALRGYLLEEARAFRRLMCDTLLDDGVESAQYAWAECSKPVEALANGEPWRIHRYELPEGHPARDLGKVSDELVLGSDDVLCEDDSRLGVRA